MLRAHKTRIRNANPGSPIALALSQHDGATRWAYNALLARLNDATQASPAGPLWLSVDDLAKTLRCEKPEWWATVDWEMLDNGRIRLATALKRWSQCRKGKHEWHQSGSCGFPRFHRRGNRKSVSFSSHVGDGKRVKWHDQRHITLPSIGTLTLAEPLPEVGWVKQVHAVREGGRWYAVLVYENGGQLPDAPGDGPVVGVDVGIKVLAFTSDGEEYDNPRWFRRGERKLRCINKAIARSIKLNPNRRTNRRGRLYGQRARLQSQQANQRQTHHRQTASAIVKSAGTVVVETLNVAGMVRNRRLAKALTDAAVGGFLRELEWQCAKRGVLLLKAGLWFPSTQICARCGGRPNARIDLSVRVYRCQHCGWQCDRDRNAALNLKQVAPALWATIKGRGGDVSPAPGPATASEASIGQGNHWQPPCFLVDGEIVAGYSDYAKS